MASEPSEVLTEFDLDVPEGKEVRVWEGNAKLRYLVLPKCHEVADGMSKKKWPNW